MPRSTPLMIHIVPGKCDFCGCCVGVCSEDAIDARFHQLNGIFCGCCVGVCPEDAIELMESSISIIEERCTNCRKCVWACPWEVIEFHREGVADLPKSVSALNSVQGTTK